MKTFTFSNEYPDDVKALLVGNEADPFGLADLRLTWLPKDWHILVHEGDEVVAHVGLVRTHVTVGGERVEVGGYGGVLTKASARGRGHARAALAVADDRLREWSVPYGFLFCRPQLVPYYSALEWQELHRRVEMEQPDGPRAFPGRVMVKLLSGRPWPDGEVRLNGLPW